MGRRRRSRPWQFGLVAKITLSVFSLAIFSATMFYALPRYLNAVALADHGRRTQGSADRVEDRNDGEGFAVRFVDYRYAVDGKVYRGSTRTKLDCAFRGPIEVFYLPEKPAFSSTDRAVMLADGRQALIVGLIFAAAVFPITVKALMSGRPRLGLGQVQ